MDTLINNRADIWSGFQTTLWLVLFAGVLATILGTLLAACRVSPISSLRAFGTSYVNILRNTPLVLILVLAIAVVPTLGFNDLSFSLGFRDFNTFFTVSMIGLALYTAAFVCEAVRSGVNSVSTGQAEAARSVGMTFTQSLRLIVLPQAFRTVIPPLTSIYIALAKNTSVVAIVGVTDAAYQMRRLSNKFTSDIWYIFIGIALGYVIIVLTISLVASLIERKVAVVR